MVLAALGNKLRAALNLDRPLEQDKCIDSIRTALLESDVSVELVDRLVGLLKKEKGAKAIKEKLVEELCRLVGGLNATTKLEKKECRVVMFVGLNGNGKTTTVMKYAAYYHRKGVRVAVICADTFRAGALQQLQQNLGHISDQVKSYGGDGTETDPAVVASQGLSIFKRETKEAKAVNESPELILIDTSGRHRGDTVLFAEMQQIAAVCRPTETILVLDGSVGQIAGEQAVAFKKAVNITSVIVTKMDDDRRGGGALSAVAQTGVPITFLGTGEKHQDFVPFEPRRFIQRLLGMGDLSGLFDLLQNRAPSQDGNPIALVSKILGISKEGKKNRKTFCFRDLLQQLKMVNSLGSLSSLVSLIPGGQRLVEGLTAKNTTQVDPTVRMKAYVAIMKSMTTYELDRDDKLFIRQPSRIKRVARGAGVAESQVEELLSKFKPFQSTVTALSSSPMASLARQSAPPTMTTMASTMATMASSMPTNMATILSAFK